MKYMSLLLILKQQPKVSLNNVADLLKVPHKKMSSFLERIRNIGVSGDMDAFEKSKLGIFNHLNFFQLLASTIIPFLGLFNANRFPLSGWLIVCLPALVSMVVLVLNRYCRYNAALLTYFIFYPLFTCFCYINGINLGVELSFILYGILSVFFIQDAGFMIFSISFSMVSYFILSVVWKTYPYQLEQINFIAYLANQLVAIVFIFYGLYLIKTENANYNEALKRQSEKLKQQAEELNQLDTLKNKLFSVISHDLKAPMYALRNLFENMHKQKIPARDIKAMLPDVNKDLNYTIALMENLLQWAKSQMQSELAIPQHIDLQELIEEVIHQLHLQADTKGLIIKHTASGKVLAWADRNMINLVLRNLVSNAIKFTPVGGIVSISAHSNGTFAELSVEDSGKGISREELEKINADVFYTTNGTAQEQGTGLGLLLCREFLAKNEGLLHIESEKGKGSIFSFTLPVTA